MGTPFSLASGEMFVCVCRAVTQEQIEVAIDGGAHTVDAVTRACCAGDDCGACHQTIEDLLEDRAGCARSSSGRLPVVRGRAA